MNKLTRNKIAASVALAAMLAGAAHAQAPAQSSDQTATTARKELSAAQIIQQLESRGYTNIHDVERDRNEWEVEATGPNGARVELTLDLFDGRVVREEPDND